MKPALRFFLWLWTLGVPSLALVACGPADVVPGTETPTAADLRIEQYRKGDVVLKVLDASGQPLASGTKVKIEQTRHKFLFGSNIFMLGQCRTPEENAAYARLFADLLNYATLPFYWWAYEPVQGQPAYAATDQIVAWCRANNVTTKGHPLAWNWMDPAWLPTDPQAAMDAQMRRIGECVTRFRGEIEFWDVVNEATEFERPETVAQSPILTEAIRRMGVPAYIRAAFQAARAANPEAVLLINDYRTGPDYGERVISQLTDDTGRPLYDVIGIQSHQHGGAWPVEEVWRVCERFATFGKPLHFTETTFLSGQLGWDLTRNNPSFNWATTPEGEQRQADDVERFYTTLFSHPAVEGITWWDFSDQGAWQSAPSGLVRADLTPKPAYDTLKRLIKGEWWTRTEVEVGANGQATFRGFFGDYAVLAETAGQRLRGRFSFDRSTRGTIEVRLSPE